MNLPKRNHMHLATFVYKRFLSAKGIERKIWTALRLALVNILDDPDCLLTIHGKLLKVPLSHSLPELLKKHVFYDRLPRRIGAYLHQNRGRLNGIDVGANIGDTIASFYMEGSDRFLAIEPNPQFHRLLVENWGWNKNITTLDCVCSSGSSEESFIIRETAGTASIVQTPTGMKMKRQALDDILDDIPSAGKANILKVDTDGHDFEVIAGAQGLIAENLPIILFECDPFGNSQYIEDCRKTFSFFQKSGYLRYLVYDNFGGLMGIYSLSDFSSFLNLLFYQLTTNFFYFDILIMREEDISRFHKAEVEFYAAMSNNKALQHMSFAETPKN